MGNPVANIFKGLAWIVFFGGFIVGMFLGKDEYGDFSVGIALIYWSAFFVVGMLYYGFAEIIQLLTDIRDKSQSTHNKLAEVVQLLTNIRYRSQSARSISSNVESDSKNTKDESTHKWLCNSCGNMISENPCPYCSNKESDSAPY